MLAIVIRRRRVTFLAQGTYRGRAEITPFFEYSGACWSTSTGASASARRRCWATAIWTDGRHYAGAPWASTGVDVVRSTPAGSPNQDVQRRALSRRLFPGSCRRRRAEVPGPATAGRSQKLRRSHGGTAHAGERRPQSIVDAGDLWARHERPSGVAAGAARRTSVELGDLRRALLDLPWCHGVDGDRRPELLASSSVRKISDDLANP